MGTPDYVDIPETSTERVYRKQIEELRDMVTSLQDKLDSIEELHQTELQHYNSYAAEDMQSRYDNTIGEIIDELKRDERMIKKYSLDNSPNYTPIYQSVYDKLNTVRERIDKI